MNTPTLSQLADIGAAAARDALPLTEQSVCVEPQSNYWRKEASAREAFARAVLDAVGYKFPVDPEREAFDAWITANPSRSSNDDLFDAWKAGRAARLSKPAPETFEAHGLTWFKHTPGDPMPCDGTSAINCLFGGRSSNDDPTELHTAGERHWGVENRRCYPIVAWRYADAP